MLKFTDRQIEVLLEITIALADISKFVARLENWSMFVSLIWYPYSTDLF